MAEDQTKLQFRIRMTPEIKAAIVAAAARNNRSINAEILSRLEESFQSGRALGIDPKDVEIINILDELERLKSKVAQLSKRK
ncbi:Arc family DNA-binding protein [Agrobacterium rhizogenes]|uniref:Arc family DNA-binding protein n=1 Tax=Rhizobium rhizogenes TaxID=359 RepID=UPI0015737D89|nr:Arc family DNA-binding protein [Rhizobium rhizogenes]NTF87470.1 Arc family DNA-binding protein [Rhizobium rhizogenes]